MSQGVVQDMPLVDSDVDIECEHFETQQMSGAQRCGIESRGARC